MKQSDNRPNLKIEFFAKDNQSSLNNSTSDYQSFGGNLTFTAPEATGRFFVLDTFESNSLSKMSLLIGSIT